MNLSIVIILFLVSVILIAILLYILKNDLFCGVTKPCPTCPPQIPQILLSYYPIDMLFSINGKYTLSINDSTLRISQIEMGSLTALKSVPLTASGSKFLVNKGQLLIQDSNGNVITTFGTKTELKCYGSLSNNGIFTIKDSNTDNILYTL